MVESIKRLRVVAVQLVSIKNKKVVTKAPNIAVQSYHVSYNIALECSIGLTPYSRSLFFLVGLADD